MAVRIRRQFRRLVGRGRRWAAGHPALRRHAPLVLSVGANGILLALIFLMVPPAEPKGVPDAPIHAVDVIIVSEVPTPLEFAPETETEETPPASPTEEESASAAGEVAEAEADGDPAPTPAAPAPAPARPEVADVDVPDTDTRRGTPDGIVAIDCNALFEDPVVARECAGAEITSDWRARVQEFESEQWQRAVEALRRGGSRAPLVGPDRYGDLGENTELYSPADPRFSNSTRPQAQGGSLSFGADYAAAFESEEEYRKFLSLYDERAYVGDGGPRPLSGWRPSWQLRDDPNIDPRQLREFLDAVEAEEPPQ